MSDQYDWKRKCREARELAKGKPPHVRALVEASIKLGELVAGIAKADPDGAKAAWSTPPGRRVHDATCVRCGGQGWNPEAFMVGVLKCGGCGGCGRVSTAEEALGEEPAKAPEPAPMVAEPQDPKRWN